MFICLVDANLWIRGVYDPDKRDDLEGVIVAYQIGHDPYCEILVRQNDFIVLPNGQRYQLHTKKSLQEEYAQKQKEYYKRRKTTTRSKNKSIRADDIKREVSPSQCFLWLRSFYSDC